jgi:putative redox protein
MADTAVTLQWSGEGLKFTAQHPSGNHFLLDGDGKNSHSPVQALALAFAGCTGSDVVDIAQKMRVPFSGLRVEVEADRNAEPPRYFKAVRMVFYVSGLDPADRDKIQRAIDLSNEKYCSVYHSLRKDLSFSTRLVLE